MRLPRDGGDRRGGEITRPSGLQVLTGAMAIGSVLAGIVLAPAARPDWVNDPFSFAFVVLAVSVGVFFGLAGLIAGLCTVGAVVFLMTQAARTQWRRGQHLTSVGILALIPAAVWLLLNLPSDSR